MSSDRKERKTFPDEPGYNIGAGIGLLAGLGVGMLATVGSIPLPLPGVSNHLADWASNAMLCATVGTIIGAVAGSVLDAGRN